jgi:hypothetical protein
MIRNFFVKPDGLMFKLFDLAVLGVGTADRYRLKVFKDRIGAILREADEQNATAQEIISQFDRLARFVLDPEKAVYFMEEVQRLVREACGGEDADSE